MSDLLRSPALARARRVAREWSDTHAERPVIRALGVAAAMRRRAADVLYFGDSSLIFTSPHDRDARRLGEMMSDAVGGSLVTYHGPAYSALLWAEIARLIADLPRPRAVIVPITVRPATHRHVAEHPVFSYRGSEATLRRARSVGPALLGKVYKRAATDAAYAEFEAIEHRGRWPVARTIGDYRRLLRGYRPATADDDAQRTLYAYFHGEHSADRPAGLDGWTRLGQHLRALDVPVVTYRTYMCLSRGNHLLGGEFTEHVEENFAVIEDRFLTALGDRAVTVDVAPPAEGLYLAPSDGTEHYNEDGRRYIVDAVLPSVAALLR